jgi:hypothetical protein
LERIQIRLVTFRVGQQDLLAIKTALRRAHKTRIIARLMVEEVASSASACSECRHLPARI